MLSELFNIDRRLRINYKRLLACPFVKKDLINTIDCYLSDFAIYHNLTTEDILISYNYFVKRYSEDIKNFISKGKYPKELGSVNNIDRIDYDISLILSTVVTIHRHRIIVNIRKYCSEVNGKTLIVGVGSGLELEILRHCGKTKISDAYDIHVSNFIMDRFKDIRVNEHKFSGKREYHDNIIAIELLEHLIDPYNFMSICHDSLKNKGKFFITTATNVPQFDHLYNFRNDDKFENEIYNLGFNILDKENIQHDSFIKKLKAKNTWYILEKM